MPNQWFIVPRGDGLTNSPERPALDAYLDAIDAYPRCLISPREFVVRVYADEETLGEIAADRRVDVFAGPPSEILNSAFEQSRKTEQWEQSIRASRGETVRPERE